MGHLGLYICAQPYTPYLGVVADVIVTSAMTSAPHSIFERGCDKTVRHTHTDENFEHCYIVTGSLCLQLQYKRNSIQYKDRQLSGRHHKALFGALFVPNLCCTVFGIYLAKYLDRELERKIVIIERGKI